MADVKRPAPKPTVEATNFRRFAADTFGLRLTNHAAQLSLLLETVDAEEREIQLKEATAVMSLSSLKVLQLILTNAVALAEKQFGPISLPPGKEEELKKLMLAARQPPDPARGH